MMTDQDLITGSYKPLSASDPTLSSLNSRLIEKSVSRAELIDTWYLEPLKKMSGSQAFICLSVCLFLYEKYLRKTQKIEMDCKFSKGHKVFRCIGVDFGISADDSFEFWSCWRNGLAHQGMPKKSQLYNWAMTRDQEKPIVITEDTLSVNPWKLRDVILDIISNHPQIWRDELAPLMQVFKKTKC
jgi:hypothetical protein